MARDERAHARSTDPETSHKAAAAITPHLSELQREIGERWCARGVMGATDLEIAIEMGRTDVSTVRSRRNELADQNIIVDSGMRRTTGSSRRQRIVWRHRDHHPNPGPIRPPSKPVTDDERDEARAMATSLDCSARQMRSEGRTLFADELGRAAELMRKLLKR